MNLLRTNESIVFEKLFPDDYQSFGCGPGGIGDWFIPDTMWGLSVKEACRQHDHDYRFGAGASDADRKLCDERLRDNMHMIVEMYSTSKIFKALRHMRVNTYYYMVRLCGENAYWKERNWIER